jgi:DNA-3-methyladenine glycosylase II
VGVNVTTRTQPGGPKVSYPQAAKILADRDPVIAQLVAEVGLPKVPPAGESHFATLVRSIVYQQLAGAAARAIHGRLIAALADDVSPEAVLRTPTETLRACGLSGRKVESLQDLAAKTLDGTVVIDPRRVAWIDDEELITRLSTVKGIGRWSAQMFLMFQLRRIDVWPVGDLAVRKGFGLAWKIPTPSPRQLELLGEPFRPYRSVVAWYCWAAIPVYGAGATPAVPTVTGAPTS